MSDQTTTLDADGWLTLTTPIVAKSTVLVACPPGWLTAPKFQIVDHDTLIAITRRIARMRTSGMMAMVQTMETIYRKHGAHCRYDAATNRVELPRPLREAFTPLPCRVTITRDDGPLTVRKA